MDRGPITAVAIAFVMQVGVGGTRGYRFLLTNYILNNKVHFAIQMLTS